MPREDIPIIEPYNPLDKRNLGASVAAAMLASPVHTLPPEPFIGAGVYAIYYRGDFAPYKRLVDLNKEGYNVPIYVGKAVPAGARKGGLGMNVDHGLALFNRLSESFNRFLIISLDVLICRYSPLFRAFPALFISEEPHKSFYYPSCFRSQK